ATLLSHDQAGPSTAERGQGRDLAASRLPGRVSGGLRRASERGRRADHTLALGLSLSKKKLLGIPLPRPKHDVRHLGRVSGSRSGWTKSSMGLLRQKHFAEQLAVTHFAHVWQLLPVQHICSQVAGGVLAIVHR